MTVDEAKRIPRPIRAEMLVWVETLIRRCQYREMMEDYTALMRVLRRTL